MNRWQGIGQSVEEAVEKGLKEMDVSLGDVKVKVLESPTSGFFGFFKKPAKVSLTRNATESEEDLLVGLTLDSIGKTEEEALKEKATFTKKRDRDEYPQNRRAEITDDAVAVATRFVEEVAYQMGAEVTIQSEKREDEIFISILGDKNGILIGKHGKTLDALQYLTGLAVHKVVEGRIRVVVDVEGYRERRKATLENLAVRYANQAVERGSKVVLEPMNPQERRLIHVVLQEDNRVETESEGEEPFRKLVIIPRELTNDFVIYVEKFQQQRRRPEQDSSRRRY